jgi:hypothetical protein
MRITTQSAVNVSESLAGFLLGSYIYNVMGEDPLMEKRLKHVDTGKFSIADLYYPSKDTAIEMKSQAHGNSALKGVVQASMYKEQTDDAVFCMQRPSRRALTEAIESFAESHGVGVIWLNGVPNICSDSMIEKATGGCPDPFYSWKERRYSTTKRAIESRSRTSWIDEYLDTIEQVVVEEGDDMFKFAISPDSSVGGFSDIYS